MIGESDKQEILESLLVGDDPDCGEERWQELLSGDDLYWVVALCIERLRRDPTETTWIRLLALAIRQTLPQLDASALEQDLALFIAQLSEMQIDEPDLRWHWLVAELQEKHDIHPEGGPKRQWPAPDNPASLVVLAVHDAMAGKSSPAIFRQQLEILLPRYPWLRVVERYHRLNYAINATRGQPADDLAARLSALSEFSRRRAVRIESATQRRPYYGSPEITSGTVRCEFHLPLVNADTWELMLEDQSLGSIHLRREPNGPITILESSGAWLSCVPTEREWRIRRAAESNPSPTHRGLSRETPLIQPDPSEDKVKLTILWSSLRGQND